jgi:hypothetical protein
MGLGVYAVGLRRPDTTARALPVGASESSPTVRESLLVSTPANPVVFARVAGINPDLSLIIGAGSDGGPAAEAWSGGETVWLDGVDIEGVWLADTFKGEESTLVEARKWLKAHAVGELVRVRVVREDVRGTERRILAVVSPVRGLEEEEGPTLNSEVLDFLGWATR